MKAMLIASFAESVITFRGPLIAALRASGCEVGVLAPDMRPDSKIGEQVRRDGVTSLSIPLRRTGTDPLQDAALFIALCRIFRRNRPDFVLPYTVKPVIYGTLAAWLSGVPRRYALVTGLGYAFTENRKGFLKIIVMLLYRLALARAHKVFFQNHDDERLFREMGLLPPSVPSVVVNGSGVDIRHFCPAPLPPEVTFLLVARLLGDKGTREYAAAAKRIRALRPSVKFRLVGWIDTNPDAISRSELDGWIAEGTLEFLGKLDDVRPAIAASTVYVLPSYREGTPRTVLEAIAMGRPIITTVAPGCRETVADGENGFLVPVKSVDALADAMLEFIKDPALAARMGRRSRQIAEEKYDVDKVNAVMLREMGITPIREQDHG